MVEALSPTLTLGRGDDVVEVRSAPYGDRSLALALDGSRDGELSRSRLTRSGIVMGLPERAIQLTIDDLLEPWIDRLDALPFDERRIADTRRLMRSRVRLLRG